jgi:hypothetical protein
MNRVREVRSLVRDFAADQRFEVAWLSSNGETGLTRPSFHPELFEQVWVDFAGKKQEAVTTYAAVSAVWGESAKGLVELELVLELATVPGRGYALIDDPEELKRWAKGLRTHLPVKLEKLAHDKGSAVLDRTAIARQWVKALVSQLPQSASLVQVRDWAAARITNERRQAAAGLAGFPGVVTSEEDRELYEVAALLIGISEGTLPGSKQLLEANPLVEQEAMWRVQLLADTLRTRRLRQANGVITSRDSG